MDLGRIFAHAVARRLAYVLVALVLAWCGIGKAHAQTCPPERDAAAAAAGYQAPYATSVQAMAACRSMPAVVMVTVDGGWHALQTYTCAVRPGSQDVLATFTGNGTSMDPNCTQSYSGAGPSSGSINGWRWATQCPAGMEWDATLGECTSDCGAGEVPDPITGECESCLSRNGAANGFPAVNTSRSFSEKCIGGCQFTAATGTKLACVQVGNPGGALSGGKVCSGIFQFSGNTCAVPPGQPEHSEPDPPEKQECIPVGTLTMCQKPNGDQCYTAGTTGRQICWKQGETGEKTDGSNLQERNPGDDPMPPEKEFPNGDTGSKQGTEIVTRTETANPDGSTTVVITVTGTYNGGSGADAGDDNDGEPDDGSGAPDGSDDEGNDSSGGADCNTPPQSSGDAILSQIATQAWFTRCAVEGKVEGGESCAGPAPTCSGDKVQCRILADQRARRCADEEGTATEAADRAAMAGESDGLEGVSEGDIFGEPGGAGETISETMFGGAAETCPVPALTVGGEAFVMPEQFWQISSWIRALFVIAAYVTVAFFVFKR